MRFFTVLVAVLGVVAATYPQAERRAVSESEVKAIVQGVEDEIYDYGYQKSFYQMGENVGGSSNTRTRMRIYIDPELDPQDKGGRVIYKLMPHGEVLRDFVIRADGLVILGGTPQNGFPPTQESNTKTVYLDDQEVCQMKRSWLERYFVVDDTPSSQRIQQAARRQKARTGFSEWEYRHSNSHKK